MKKSIVLGALLGLFVFTGCDSFTPASPDDLNFKAASPTTQVGAEFTIGEAGDGWENFDDAPRDVPPGHKKEGAAKASCDDFGTYYADANADGKHNVTQYLSKRCGKLADGEAINIKLTGIVANFVQPRSGNLQLNFTVCGYTEGIDPETGESNGIWQEDCDASAFVHYQKTPQDRTRGAGAVVGVDGNGVEWLVFLDSSNTNIEGNAFHHAAGEWTLDGLSARQLNGTLKTTSATLQWSVAKAW